MGGPEKSESYGKTRTMAVIMVGGPTKGTRFRPLSFKVAKPLFPIAGQPMVHHAVLACKKIPNLTHILLMGFYDEREFSIYCSTVSSLLNIPVRYLRENGPQGSAGGLHSFQDLILEESPDDIVILNCDTCCNFPFKQMYAAHKGFGGLGTMLVKKVPDTLVGQHGELIIDADTKELIHYFVKPAILGGEYKNCGVYIFTTDILKTISDVSRSRRTSEGFGGFGGLGRWNSLEALQSATKPIPNDVVRLDEGIVKPLAGKKQMYAFETPDFWEQMKSPGMSVKCSSLYLKTFRRSNPGVLAKGENIVGNVFVHPSAKIHPTAKIGPNASVSPNARIGPGVRLLNCIILDDVDIMDNAVVMHAIVGWKSTVGKWSRVQGNGDYNHKLGITILAEDVTVEDEVVVVKSMVLPHKSLNSSVIEEIIL